MAKGSNGTRSNSPSSAAAGRTTSYNEGLYQGRDGNEYIEYEIRRNSRTGNYELRSHSFLKDSFGNEAGRTDDLQLTASSLKELNKKIKKEGYKLY